MTPLKPGSLFGNVYEIVRPISAGGMGIVYEVVHRGTMRRRALKVMLAHIIDDPVMRARFSQEAVVAAGVRSEHITEVFDAGIDADSNCPYLVMELLQGEDLGARLKRGERYSSEETLELVSQTGRALAKTHEQGIVHRDLKPDNLFLTRRDDGSPWVKILDFGIAKVVKSNATGPQATTKTLGTPYYMAREQITGESKLIGPESDLYALAHITYTMLVGAPYFQDESQSAEGNILAVLMAVGSGAKEPASVRALRRGVILPASFDPWFARGTALSPVGRFRSAAEMIDALRTALTEPTRIVAGMTGPISAPSGAVSPLALSSASLGGASPASSNAAVFQETNSPQELMTAPATSGRKRSWVFAGALSVALGGALAFAGWRVSAKSAAVAPPDVTSAAEPPAQAGGDTAPRPAAETSPRPAIAGVSSAPAAAPTEAASTAPSAKPVATSKPAGPLPTASPATAPASPTPAATQDTGVKGYAGSKGPWEDHL